MNTLNFSNEKYKLIALSLQSSKESNHTFNDAFLLLINELSFGNLDNLCRSIQDYYLSLNPPTKLNLEECYKLTQNIKLEETDKNLIVELAIECIKSGNTLGSYTINDGTINTSEWINHCYYSSEVCSVLSKELGLDEESAKIFGLLHDYGRKYDHTFNHTIKGFEDLVDNEWYNEATSCLTHSFVMGERCSNNEPALKGFYVDDLGNEKWEPGSQKDDIGLFLEKYKYSEYDTILTIADLMATSKGIISPKERIKDIATRRIIDPTNRGYFLANFTNTLINVLKKCNYIDNNVSYIKANKFTSFAEIEDYFYKVSEYFYSTFKNMINNKNEKQKT